MVLAKDWCYNHPKCPNLSVVPYLSRIWVGCLKFLIYKVNWENGSILPKNYWYNHQNVPICQLSHICPKFGLVGSGWVWLGVVAFGCVRLGLFGSGWVRLGVVASG